MPPTQLLFGLLPPQINDQKSYGRWLCEWLEERYQAGQRVLLVVETAQRLQELDRLLWVFKDCSVVPHRIWPAEDAVLASESEYPQQLLADYPILLLLREQLSSLITWCQQNSITTCEWLVHDGDSDQALELAPLTVVQRVMELVPNMDSRKAQLRQIYRRYQQHGVQPVTQQFGDNK